MPEPVEIFEARRPHLLAIAYGMLGSVSDAEDVVQDAFLGWQRVHVRHVDSPERYLERIVTRLCIDQRRTLKRRREEYVGVWLREPVVRSDEEPEAMAVLAESLSLALLRVLETPSPIERAVFLLCEVFGYDHAVVARLIGKTGPNTRQILRRARLRLRAERPRYAVSREEAERLMTGFLQAASRGDMEALLSVLGEDVTWFADGGGKVPAATRPIHGARDVARFVIGLARKLIPGFTTRFTDANGQLAILVYLRGTLLGVLCPSTAEGRIRELDWVLNPDKLRRVPGASWH